MIAALAIGAHGYVMLGEFRQPQPLPPQSWPAQFKVITINIMGDNTFANGGRIADFLMNSGADVIFIQESAPIGPHIDRLKTVYPYRLGCGAKTITCDSSLWSKHPLVDGEVATAGPIYRDRLMLATIDFGGKKVNFANVHLTKPYFDNFHQIELKKIKEKLADYTGRNPGSVLLAGDFNTSILTPDVRAFLRDTGLMTADREPNTIPVDAPALGLAIDHMFVSGDDLRFKSLQALPDVFGSNHFGLTAEIFIQDPTASYPLQ